MDKQNVAVYLERQIQNASPAEQLVMLYDGAIRFYTKAKYCIEQGDIEGRFNNGQRAMQIVTYLLDILDVEKGGEVSQRLSRIYAYILRKHMDVDMRNSAEAIDEIIGHLRTLRASWDAIAKGEHKEEGKSDSTKQVRNAIA